MSPTSCWEVPPTSRWEVPPTAPPPTGRVNLGGEVDVRGKFEVRGRVEVWGRCEFRGTGGEYQPPPTPRWMVPSTAIAPPLPPQKASRSSLDFGAEKKLRAAGAASEAR